MDVRIFFKRTRVIKYGVANYEPRSATAAKITVPTRPALLPPPVPPQEEALLMYVVTHARVCLVSGVTCVRSPVAKKRITYFVTSVRPARRVMCAHHR